MSNNKKFYAGRRLHDELRKHNFIYKIAPSENNYYVNREGFQVVLTPNGKPSLIRLLNPAGYTIFSSNFILLKDLKDWTTFKRNQKFDYHDS
jgi:hypothetical protein